MVVSNPPHFLHSGVESPDGKRNRARRIDPELAMVFASATSKLLKNRGAFSFTPSEGSNEVGPPA